MTGGGAHAAASTGGAAGSAGAAAHATAGALAAATADALAVATAATVAAAAAATTVTVSAHGGARPRRPRCGPSGSGRRSWRRLTATLAPCLPSTCRCVPRRRRSSSSSSAQVRLLASGVGFASQGFKAKHSKGWRLQSCTGCGVWSALLRAACPKMTRTLLTSETAFLVLVGLLSMQQPQHSFPGCCGWLRSPCFSLRNLRSCAAVSALACLPCPHPDAPSPPLAPPAPPHTQAPSTTSRSSQTRLPGAPRALPTSSSSARMT